MITRSVAVVEAGAVLRTLSSRPPLTLRRIRHDDPRVCALCLVNSAAGPLAADEIDLHLVVGDGAHAELTSAGAGVAQGRPGGGRAVQRTTVSVGENAHLRADAAPLIVARGATIEVSVDLELAATASLRWRELLVLGRSGEEPGRVHMAWHVSRAGEPVLRQSIDLSDAVLRGWPGMLARGRVLASALLTSPTLAARTIADDPSAVAQAIDEHTVLATVLDSSAASATRRLAALVAGFHLSAADQAEEDVGARVGTMG